MKLRDVVRGKLKTEDLTFSLLDGTEVTVSLRLLDVDDDAAILEYAEAEAREKKAEPKPGSPIYDYAKARAITLHCCLEQGGSDPIKDRFFESVAQMKGVLDSDRIGLIVEAQERLQDSVGARPSKMGPDEFFKAVVDTARRDLGEELPFESWAPVLRRSFVHSICALYMNLLQDRSPTSLDFEGSAASSSPT